MQQFAHALQSNLLCYARNQEDNNDSTFSRGNFMDIQLIIILVSSVSGANAKNSPLEYNNSKTCSKFGDIPFPTSTNVSLSMFLKKISIYYFQQNSCLTPYPVQPTPNKNQKKEGIHDLFLGKHEVPINFTYQGDFPTKEACKNIFYYTQGHVQ